MKTKVVETYWARIYIAGDYNRARDICRNYCYKEGACVNVTKNQYIYTGGEESGVIIEIINYPRFPKSNDELDEQAYQLGLLLRSELYQDSFTVVTPTSTLWISSRED